MDTDLPMACMTSYQVTQFAAPLTKVERPVPQPGPDEILLRVLCCGVCHTDLHLLDGHFDMGRGRQLSLGRAVRLPHTPGHEIVASVSAVGSAVSDVAPGSTWLLYPWIGCGQCPLCHDGDEHLCDRPRSLGGTADGGFSDHILVPHQRYLVDFGAVAAEQACTWACSGLTAFSALKKAGAASAARPLLVIGAGGVGQAVLHLCRTIHDFAAVVADIDPAKRSAALLSGAASVLDPGHPDTVRSLLKAGQGFATVIDCVGSQQSLEFGMTLLRKGGKLIVVGLYGGACEIPVPSLPLRSISLIGSYVGSLAELQELAALGRAGRIAPMTLSCRPLARAQLALDDLRAGNVSGRAVLVP
jgi:alcohol dehydrogenase/propanol-preferring alcohol dehydrogenase